MGIFSKLFGKHDESAFPFADSENLATITCRHVMNDNKPILLVSHDLEDGMWQFLCGSNSHDEADAMVVALSEVYYHDMSVGAIRGLPPGSIAERDSIDSDWHVYNVVEE